MPDEPPSSFQVRIDARTAWMFALGFAAAFLLTWGHSGRLAPVPFMILFAPVALAATSGLVTGSFGGIVLMWFLAGVQTAAYVAVARASCVQSTDRFPARILLVALCFVHAGCLMGLYAAWTD